MKQKNVFVLFCIVFPVALALRFIQVFVMINPDNGFYYPEYVTWGTVLILIMALVIAALIIVSKMDHNKPKDIPGKSTALSTASLIMAVGILYKFVSLIPAIDTTKPGNFIANNLMTLIIMLFCLGSALYFMIQCFGFYKGFLINPMLPTLPVLFCISNLISEFMKYTSLADISENIFDVVVLCLVLLFWLMSARVLSGIGFETAMKWIYGIGYSAAIFCFICTIPRIVSYFVYAERAASFGGPDLTYLAMGAYIVIFLLTLSFHKTENGRTAEARESLEAADNIIETDDPLALDDIPAEDDSSDDYTSLP